MKTRSLSVFPGLLTGQSGQGNLRVNDPAPVFSTKRHDGGTFDLRERRGQWTVLYFYPKASTPGCTKQACAFRDGIKAITSQGAEVFGISNDSVDAQRRFHAEHRLTFSLLADPGAVVTRMYGAKMFLLPLARRWTFIIGPDLTIKAVFKGVDPVKDADNVAQKLKSLKQQG